MSHSKALVIAAKVGLRVASAQISRQRIAFSRGFSSKCLRPSRGEALDEILGADEGVEVFRHLGAVALGEAGRDRVLRGEIAIEVARAHLRLGGDVLHGGAMEARAHEAALGRVEDADAALGLSFVVERAIGLKGGQGDI